MNTEIIDDLLEKEVYIIDFLPETVPKNCGGSYFDVEYYILNSKNSKIIKDRFLLVILKIMCYYHVSVFWNGFVENPTPELIESAISEIMESFFCAKELSPEMSMEEEYLKFLISFR